MELVFKWVNYIATPGNPRYLTKSETQWQGRTPRYPPWREQSIITVVTIDNKVHSDKIPAFLATNNRVGGALCADQMIASLKAKGIPLKGTVGLANAMAGIKSLVVIAPVAFLAVTKLAKEDPSLNVCDLYLFQGAPDTTVMAMTVNPDVVLSAPDTLHIEGLYAFRLDLTGDAREDVVFKFRFNEPRHVNGDEHVHVQKFQVRRATGEAIGGDKGELLIEGDTGKVHSESGIRAFVGLAPDLFAADAVGTQSLQKAFYNEHRYDGDAFLRQRLNFFNNRNITAIVLEVPNHLIGKGTVHAWATASLYGHAPERQVSRWGLPMITHLFLNDPGNQEVKETYNKSVPSDDIALFSGYIADYIQKMTTYAGSAVNPEEYGKQMATRLCPNTLPYELGTAAAFDLARFNGRPLGDDAMDVMLTLLSNRPLQDGAAPDRNRIRTEFPYFGEPYSKEEQKDVVPWHPRRSH
jgi:hypothetical protein